MGQLINLKKKKSSPSPSVATRTGYTCVRVVTAHMVFENIHKKLKMWPTSLFFIQNTKQYMGAPIQLKKMALS